MVQWKPQRSQTAFGVPALRGPADAGPTFPGGVWAVKPPAAAECFRLLQAFAAPDYLLRHTELVRMAAVGLARLCRADAAYCIAGAVLHDVGKTPGAIALAARTAGSDPASLAALDHGILGAGVLRSLGGAFPAVAAAVERHVLTCVLTGPAPVTLGDQIVYMADKLVGMEWMGFRGRTADIVSRHGSDCAAALPGAELVLWNLAARACLSAADLEGLVRDEVIRTGS